MNEQKVKNINIASEMKTSFLDYAMSVIVARALPDVRDGLKPVHRRILYAMNDLGMHSDKAYKKSARIVGEVIGKYHPHGDSAVYETMVRMAQDFSYRHMLVDGHGNFGSIDGDGAAAMRYTEARMSKIAMELVKDINKDTVNFVDNYDGEEKEPSVMPSYFPNLIVNGATGIAVGMATNIPPHNLGESVDATIAIIDNPNISTIELMEIIKGPDFPTGGIIMGRSGIHSAFETGRGSVTVRAKVDIEELANGKKKIIVTEIPYQVNKANLVEKIAMLVRDKQIEGITDLRDETNRHGIRIVIETRKDVQSEVLLNQLYRMTALQTTFGINTLALVDGNPKLLGIKALLNHYIAHQVEVVRRRTQFELNKALDRAHILEGLRIALDNIDRIIEVIRGSMDDNEAISSMMQEFLLSEIQAKAILDTRLKRLTGLERGKIEGEYLELQTAITNYTEILSSESRVLNIIKMQLSEVKRRFADTRRTEIQDSQEDVLDEDLIPVEDVVVALTLNGYIKRTTVDTFQTQNRGGKGIKGMSTHSDDIVDQFIHMSTHDSLMLFTNFGKVYRLRGFHVPSASRISKGIPVVNLLNLDKAERVRAMVPVKEESHYQYLVFATKNGLVKRVTLDQFESIRQNGKIAITLNDDDELVAVKPTTGNDQIILAGNNGKAVKFDEIGLRPMGRTAAGVKGFNPDGNELIGLTTDKEGLYILSVTEKGYGKKSLLEEYRLTKRGGKGVKTVSITEKNGKLVSVRAVNGDEDILIVTDLGQVIRINLSDVGTYGRAAQGVKLIKVNGEAKVSAIAIINTMEENVEPEVAREVAL